MSAAKFPLGRVVATPGALGAIDSVECIRLLARHNSGDWGDLCEDDCRSNDSALEAGGRLFSAYHSEANRKIWVITEADRSATTLLLPEEY